MVVATGAMFVPALATPAVAAAKSCKSHASAFDQYVNQTGSATNYITCNFTAYQIHVKATLWWSRHSSGPWTQLAVASGDCFGVVAGIRCAVTTALVSHPDPCAGNVWLQARGTGWGKVFGGSQISTPVDKDTIPAGCLA